MVSLHLEVSLCPDQICSPVLDSLVDGQKFPIMNVVVAFGRCEGHRIVSHGVQFGRTFGVKGIKFSLLREYGSHAIS